MRHTYFMTLCLMFANLLPVTGQETPASDSMKSIFNGNDLSGWSGDPRLWSVKDGVIHGETTPDKKANGNTFLIWQGGKLKDFELRLSFRCSTTNNSGVQYRSKHITEGDRIRNKWVVRGYQHEIRNETTLPSVAGFIYDEGGRRGRICLVGENGQWRDGAKMLVGDPLITGDEYAKLFKLDDWNEIVIVARGRHLQHYMNGRLILDFTDSEERALTEGILALQLHAGKPMWAEFKNIRVKTL